MLQLSTPVIKTGSEFNSITEHVLEVETLDQININKNRQRNINMYKTSADMLCYQATVIKETASDQHNVLSLILL